jgi:hypothetical protein
MKSVVRSILWAIAAVITEVAAQCDVNLNTIRLKEVNADITQQRTYTICPGTQLNIGTLDPNDINSLTGGFYFQARPNLHIQCGPDGLSANNCTVVGGTLQVDGTDWLGNTDPPFNFKLSGFTFREVERYNFWGNMPGSITFYDCIFRVSLLDCGWREFWLAILTPCLIVARYRTTPRLLHPSCWIIRIVIRRRNSQ